jgi:transposase-like protein
MTNAVRARYTLEFKQEALRLVEAGQSIAAAARTLGMVAKHSTTGSRRSAKASPKVERLCGRRFKTRRTAKDETIA